MKRLIFILLTMSAVLSSCVSVETNTNPSNVKSQTGWEEQLSSMMPYLGHRNWIVISDMAYPKQSGEGILTLYANEPYTQVLKKVKGMVDGAPHVFAHIWNDYELSFIQEEDAPGIDALRAGIREICGDESQSRMHEQLISRLDEAGKLYSVVIIKTPLTIPYTTTFFELDCAYWGSEKQARLNAAVAAASAK